MFAVKGVIFDLVIYNFIRHSHSNLGLQDWVCQTYIQVSGQSKTRQYEKEYSTRKNKILT